LLQLGGAWLFTAQVCPEEKFLLIYNCVLRCFNNAGLAGIPRHSFDIMDFQLKLP
jgi:hypothetical protein